ncbi:serine hydrolase domain-containing protein [Lewinella sp. IMCC34191]|uniref:serine hydrolase domain-containing protein n=1 Tax=Lewinella sp. IMCC34191 TaxID=2259172 RepID=UPI000E23B6F7|nr:serine hydrolase [Lewinella sp. IMCC34191]
MIRFALKTLCLLLLAHGVAAQQRYFPQTTGEEWQERSAAELGYDAAAIEHLYTYLEAANSKAFLLLEDGEIVLEHYMNGFGPDSLHYWASAGKTLLSAAFGIAEAEGHLNLNESSRTYLGNGWTSCTAEEEATITVLDHLRMTTGLDDKGDFFCTEPECLSCLAEPGTRWAYYNAPCTLLHDVLEAATGHTPTRFIRDHFRATTGLVGAYVPLGRYNRVYVSTARSMARFGLLLLNGGAWDGRQVIPADYYTRMTTPSQELNQSYGLLTWLNGQDSYMLNGAREVFDGSALPDAPADTYFAAGANGQFINVTPSRGLVWVRVGEEPFVGGGEYVGADFNNEIWKRINSVLPKTSTALAEPAPAPAAAVFPNPVHDRLRIHASEAMETLTLYDLAGRPLRRRSVSGDAGEFPVTGIPAGIYRLVIHYRAGRASQVRVSIQ